MLSIDSNVDSMDWLFFHLTIDWIKNQNKKIRIQCVCAMMLDFVEVVSFIMICQLCDLKIILHIFPLYETNI